MKNTMLRNFLKNHRLSLAFSTEPAFFAPRHIFSKHFLPSMKWPDQRYQRRRHHRGQNSHRRTNFQVVGKPVAARPHDHQIGLIAQGGQKACAGAKHNRNDEGHGTDTQLFGDTGCDGKQ